MLREGVGGLWWAQGGGCMQRGGVITQTDDLWIQAQTWGSIPMPFYISLLAHENSLVYTTCAIRVLQIQENKRMAPPLPPMSGSTVKFDT